MNLMAEGAFPWAKVNKTVLTFRLCLVGRLAEMAGLSFFKSPFHLFLRIFKCALDSKSVNLYNF